MSNIYGSYSQMDWYTAVCFRKSLRWMKETDREKYGKAIERELFVYNELFKAMSTPANDNTPQKIAA